MRGLTVQTRARARAWLATRAKRLPVWLCVWTAALSNMRIPGILHVYHYMKQLHMSFGYTLQVRLREQEHDYNRRLQSVECA